MNIINAKIIDSTPRQIDWICCSFNDSPSPCDGCQNASKCAEQNLACPQFINYIEDGSNILTNSLEKPEPSRRFFVKAFAKKSETSLSEEELKLIKQLNKQRGMNHKRIADLFYILPETVRKIVGAS